jgi:DNA-binding transcriptional LysR family regulator
MVPTALAKKLIDPIEEGLTKLTQAVSQTRQFDPATSSQLFRIAINDIGQLIFMPKLLATARTIAPGIKFETIEATPLSCRQLLVDGLADLAIGSWKPMGSGFFQQRLFEESYVALLSSEHHLKAEKIRINEYLAAEHIVYRPSGTSYDALQTKLSELNVLEQRKVVLTAAHSLGLSAIVASSGLLLSVPYRLAVAMANTRSDLRIAQLPFTVSPFPIRHQWHERSHADKSHQWLRHLVFEQFNDLP